MTNWTGRRSSLVRLAALLTASALLAVGCGSGDGEGGGDEGTTGKDNPIKFAAVEGWTDQTGTAYLLSKILEDNGYKTEITKLSDNAPVFAATAKGDVDIFSSTWIERTHEAYWDQYGDDLEDIGTYYEGAALYLAVPEYSKAQSIADLPGMADDFDKKVYGIEPGAGLMKLTAESAFPKYGLDEDFTLIKSSTTAMLAQLKKAIGNEDEIVVTLWKPFWANQTYPVRPLEDPEKAFGDPESLHTVATKGFSERYPEVAEMIKNFKLSDEQYGTLEDTIVNKVGQGEEAKAIEMWLKENPDYEPALSEYLK